MQNITMPGVSLHTENYRGFDISWQEPPMMANRWTANVVALMGGRAEVITAGTREDMIAAAKAYIDGVLGSSGKA